MTTLTIDRVEKVDDLFQLYPGRGTVQPCHLALDLDTGEMSCDYDPSVDGSDHPKSVHHGVVLWIPIPCLTADAANALMEAVAPLAERILADSAVEWDGQNNVGVMYEDAAAALAELTARCNPEGDWDDSQLVASIAAADWFAEEGPARVAARLGITAATTDAELAQIVEAEERQAAVIGQYGHTVLVDADAYLATVRRGLAEGGQ